ncbi:MAG: hypothetical protein EUB_03431 [Eubacterium sp.]|uniref:peptidoglycan DD-metalloendopeptidase family protein n=1 Tax=Eubacterium sp. TaxID=142586 RepID=UPI00302476D0
MAVTDTIVIKIAAEYSDNTSAEFQKSAKPADRYCESVNKLKKQLDSVSKTKVRTNLEANDRATQVIDKVKDNIDYLKNHKAQIPLIALDKASSVIDSTKNKAVSLASKTFRFTLGVIDKATAPLQKIWNYATSLKGIMTGVFAGAATQQFVIKPAQMAIDRQNITTAFENLLGSKEAATERVSDLTAFAGQTPFTRDEIFQASRVLQVFTGDALATADGLKTVGDVASGTQQDFSEVAVWIGRLYSGLKSGTPIGEATARLQEMGAISGDSRAKLEALAKSGRDISETWPEATAEFAQFDGMMLKMSDGFQNLLLGAKSFVNNNVWQRIGAGIINGFTPALQRFRDWRSENKDLIAEMANNIESGVTNIVSKVSRGIEKVFDITSKLMKDDTFKNADFMGKAGMLWDQLIATPFDSWWSGGGKEKVTEGVKSAANSLLNILKDVVKEGMEIAFSNPITGTMAVAFGIKHGTSIIKGLVQGINTAKGVGTELKNAYGTTKSIISLLSGSGTTAAAAQPDISAARHDPEVQATAQNYRKAINTLSEAKKKFSEEQQELVEKANNLKGLQANNAGDKAIKEAEKALEKSRKHIKESAADIKNIENDLIKAKENFSISKGNTAYDNINKTASDTKKSFGEIQNASKDMTQTIKNDSEKATIGISGIGSATTETSKTVGVLSKAIGFLASPVGLMVGALAALGGAAYFFSKKQEEAEQATLNAGNTLISSLDTYEQAKKASEEATQSYIDQKNAIQEYRDLASELNSGDLGEDERIQKLERQEELLGILKEKYPEVFEQNLSTEESFEKIEALADQQERLASAVERSAKAQTELDFAKAVESLPELMQQLADAESAMDHFQQKIEYAGEQQIRLTELATDVKELEKLKLNTEVDPELVEEAKKNVKEKIDEIYQSAQEAGDVSLLNDKDLETLKTRLQNNLDPLTDAYKNVDSAFENLGSRMGTWQGQLETAVGNVQNFKGQIDALKENAEKFGMKWAEIEATAKEKMAGLDKSTDLSKGKVAGLNTAIGDLKGKEINIDVNINEKHTKNGMPVSDESSKPTFSVPGLYTAPTEIHADGGFMTRPHFGLVAEDGAESIIPLSPKRRSRGIALWQETGRRLGVMAYAEGGIVGQAESYPMAAGGGAYASSGAGGPSVSGGGGEAGRVLSFETGGLKEDLAEADQFFQEYSSNVLTAGLSTWDNLKNNVTSKTQEMNDTDRAKFDEFAQYFTTFGSGLVLTGAAAFDALKGGVVTKSTDTVKFGVSKFNEFSSYVGTLPPIFGGYGADMMSELAYGIESQRAAVLKSTSTLVQDLLSTFITGLGIHSPSKKMQWVGEMMAAGIIKGLSADQITQYVYYIIDQMQSSFSSGKLDVGTVVDKLDDNIPALVAKLGVDPKEAASLIYPLLGTAGTLTSVFGGRDAPTAGASTNHGGIDLAAPTGTQIAAVLGGLVTIAGEYGGYGNAVKIDHGNGVESLYGHMSAVGVAPGQQVTAGQVIGNVGSTGISTGPHLHLSMYKDGEAIDPLPYVHGAPIMAGNTLAGALMAEYNRRKFGVGAAGALGGGGDVASWIMQALAITGQSMDFLDELMYIAQMESGGDPNAINLWDSNAAAGHPSKGLMQTIDSTFAAYALPGYDDIWNPVHNTIAAIRYLMDVYGGIQNHPGLGGSYVGYAVGTREVPQDMLAVIHKDEAIFPAAQNPFSKSGGNMIADMVSNVLPFPEMESNSIRNENGDTGQTTSVEAVPVVVPQSTAAGGVSVSINLGGISISIDGSSAGTPQDIEALLRAQIPGIANDLCAQIAQKLAEIFSGMPIRMGA